MDASLFSGIFGIVAFLFLVVLGLLWFLLPFAVFGVKDRLSALERQLATANSALAAIANNTAALEHYSRNIEARVAHMQSLTTVPPVNG